MGGHVIVTFGRMDEQGIAVANQSREKAFQIGANVGVGVFLDEKGSGGMLQVQREQALADAAFGNESRRFASEIVQAAPFRPDAEFSQMLA
jgi:hypothetical protein